MNTNAAHGLDLVKQRLTEALADTETVSERGYAFDYGVLIGRVQAALTEAKVWSE